MGGLDERFRRSEDYEFMLRLTRRFKGVSVAQRIINVRRHEGARGDAQVRHSAGERHLVHFDFDARAFEMVRRDVPIGAYIGKPEEALSARECFEGWLVRAATMARHGVWQGFKTIFANVGGAPKGMILSLPRISRRNSLGYSATTRRSTQAFGKTGIPDGLSLSSCAHLARVPFARSCGASTTQHGMRMQTVPGWLAIRSAGFAVATNLSGVVIQLRPRA